MYSPKIRAIERLKEEELTFIKDCVMFSKKRSLSEGNLPYMRTNPTQNKFSDESFLSIVGEIKSLIKNAFNEMKQCKVTHTQDKTSYLQHLVNGYIREPETQQKLREVSLALEVPKEQIVIEISKSIRSEGIYLSSEHKYLHFEYYLDEVEFLGH